MNITTNSTNLLYEAYNSCVLTSKEQNECMNLLQQQGDTIHKINNNLNIIHNDVNNASKILNKIKSIFTRRSKIQDIHMDTSINKLYTIKSDIHTSLKSEDVDNFLLDLISSELNEIKAKANYTNTMVDKHTHSLDTILLNTKIINCNINKIDNDICTIYKQI